MNSIGINDEEDRFENYGVSVRISATSTKASASTDEQGNTSITLMPASSYGHMTGMGFDLAL